MTETQNLPNGGAGGAVGSFGASESARYNTSTVFQAVSLKEQNLQRLLFKSWTYIIVLSLLLTAAAVYIFILAQRVGTVVLLDRTTGVAVSVNNREYGKTPAGELTSDKLVKRDMIACAMRFLKSVYEIHPIKEVRLQQASDGVKMMTPLSSVKYGTWLDDNNILERQISESQSSTWTVDENNIKIETNPNGSIQPVVLQVYGEQRLKKVVGGATRIEVKQVLVPVTLVPDPDGRTERNIGTGFNVDAFGPEKVLSHTEHEQDTFTVTNQPAPRR
jgi:hypothetical protein